MRDGRGALAWLLSCALVGLVVACSSGGSGEPGEVASAEAPERTQASEPPATDPDAVRPYVEDLLVRYDAVVNQIVADPAVVTERDGQLVEDYVTLFEPDSQFVDDVLASWAEEGESGRSVLPYGDEHPAFTTHLDGEVAAMDEDENEVTFSTCVERRMSVYEDDVLRQETPYFAEPGSGVAVRVDGAWRLRRLSVSAGEAGCTGGVV